MLTCITCGEKFSSYAKIDGVVKNLSNRRRCLKCHSWGTPRYPKRTDDERIKASRLKSKKYYEKMKRKLGVNPVTYRNKLRKRALVSFLGGACVLCGYNKTQRNITFHHHCLRKEQTLDSRSLDVGLKRIYMELKKCAMVCHNCHGEIHDGLVTIPEDVFVQFQNKVNDIKGKKWKDLVLRLGIEPSAQCL